MIKKNIRRDFFFKVQPETKIIRSYDFNEDYCSLLKSNSSFQSTLSFNIVFEKVEVMISSEIFFFKKYM